jgi:hypothetical protein
LVSSAKAFPYQECDILYRRLKCNVVPQCELSQVLAGLLSL